MEPSIEEHHRRKCQHSSSKTDSLFADKRENIKNILAFAYFSLLFAVGKKKFPESHHHSQILQMLQHDIYWGNLKTCQPGKGAVVFHIITQNFFGMM